MTKRCVLLVLSCCLLLPIFFGARASAAEEVPSLAPLARGLAGALAVDTFRQGLAEELTASPYVEGRIPLKRLLARESELREELLWGRELAPWTKLEETLPELELYFPIDAHRDGWAGDATIQVAVPIGGSERYRVYELDGSEHVIDGSEAPRVPTLVLAPSEIDFDDPDTALVGGARTGAALLRQVEPTPDARNGAPLVLKEAIVTKSSGVDNSRHTYLTAFRITNWHEPAIRGDMEIEVFGSLDGSYSECHRYTDIEPGTTYYLPAPGSSGDDKIAYAVPTGTNTVDVKAYEDDDTGCSIRSGDDYVGEANLQITQYGTLYGTSNNEASVRVETQSTTCGDSLCQGDESRGNCCGDCASCGDGVCSSCENGSSCSADCYTCGNGLCERTKGESEWNCSLDCDSCGNGICEPNLGESEFSCNQDCCGSAIICPE